MTYSLLASPDGVSIDETSGLLTWTPTDSDVGDNFIRVQVADGEGGVDTQSFTLPVTAAGAVNNRPVINNSPRDAIGLGDDYVFQVEATDPDNDPLTYSLTDAPVGMTIDDNGLVIWPAEQTQLGEYSFTVKVEDGRGAVVEAPYTVNVVQQTVNGTPTITSTPSFVATIGDQYIYEAEATDPDNDPIVWSLVSGPVGLTLNETTGRVSWTPTIDQFGFHEVIIEAIAAQGASFQQGFGLNVSSTNAPPLITSAPPTLAFGGTAYTYDLQASDPNGDALTYSLTVAPDGMTIDESTGLIEWTPTSEQLGIQAVTVSVADGRGGVVEQRYSVNVASDVPNQPPQITSRPAFGATAGQDYTYQLEATDPENLTIRYQLLEGPAGMTVDEATGLLTWAPALADVGSYQVKVVALDPLDLGATQTFTLTVGDGNQQPNLNNRPDTNALVGQTYAFDLNVTDPDGDAVTYTLEDGPEGMTLDNLGRLRWTPTTEDVGTERIRITFRDETGPGRFFEYDLNIIADTTAPQVALEVSADPVDINDSVIVQVNAVDDVAIDEIGLTVDGTAVALDSNGSATLTFDAVGSVELVATALDTSGNAASTDFSLSVIAPSPNAPIVSILTPGAGESITSFVDVVGTVDDLDGDLVSYELTATPFAGGPTTTLATGTSEINEGVLGEFDGTLLRNDSYILELSAVDAGGNTSSTSTVVDVEGDLKIGNYTLSFVDLSIPLTGIPIVVSRTYDTLNANISDDFGHGWSMDLRDTDLTDNVGESGLEDSGIYNAFFDGAAVYITLPNGEREKFIFQPQARGLFGLTTYKPRFVAADGDNTSTLTVDDIDLQRTADGRYVTLSQIPYNPASTLISGTSSGNYILTTKDGIKYAIDGDSGDLEKVTDRNGNTLTYTEGGVFSSTGKQVTFERDPQGRITAVIDPEGNRITYEYDDLGDLIAVTDREGNRTQFNYEEDIPHFLDDIIDPLGRIGVRSDYNNEGRLARFLDVNGNPTELIYDTENLVETVRDALGNETVFIRDSRGNIITEIDAEGAVLENIYDINDNLISQTNPLGYTTEYTYDSRGNLLSATDPLGNVTRLTYGAFNQISSVTDPLGNTSLNIYDARGNLIATTNALANTFGFEYDNQGNLISLQDPGQNEYQYAYNSDGLPILMIDALGHETVYVYDDNGNQTSISTKVTTPSGGKTLTLSKIYDANGNVTSTTNSEGYVIQHEYDALGNLIAIIDGLGTRQEFNHDDRGLLTEFVDSENNSYQYEYDALGRVTKDTDPLGRTTNYIYDKVGRLVETILPDETPLNLSDNPRIRIEYDLTGQIIAEIDANGNRSETTYDQNGNPISLINNGQVVSSYTYNANDRLISQQDALGREDQFIYDALGQIVETIDPLGNTSKTTYDALGRVIAEKDASGNQTQFEYDTVGNLVGVVDSLGRRTEFIRDELGNQIESISPNGNMIKQEYNGFGFITATELATGERQSITYNSAYEIASSINDSGNTVEFGYDKNKNRTISSYSDGTSDISDYNQVGGLASHTDRFGRSSTYEYDAQGQLTSIEDTLGNSTGITYDLNGNVLSNIDALGNTISYSYDDFNRQTSITNGNRGTVSYAYDLVGNLTELTDPLGNETVVIYDDLNRPIAEINELGSTRDFTYDESSNLSSITDRNGRITTFEYDSLNRLIAERWIDEGNVIYEANFAYGPDGDLLTARDSYSSYTYDYDATGRVTSVDINGILDMSDIILTQDYDNAGRQNQLTAEINGLSVLINSYSYDVFDRVIGINQQSGIGAGVLSDKRVEFSYNALDQITAINRYDDLNDLNPLVSSTHSYDELGRLTDISHSNERGVIGDYDYSYDAIGQIVEMTTLDGTSSYTYDSATQLTEATHTFQTNESYTYDANGNRTNAGYQIGPNNQLLSDGIYTYQYDGEGNRISRNNILTGDITEYKWDFHNRLVGVVTRNSEAKINFSAEYIYDINDRRIAKLIDFDGDGPGVIEEEYFIYDGDNILFILNNKGQLKQSYLHGAGIDQILAVENLEPTGANEQFYWTLVDHQGTVRDVVDGFGKLENHIIYDAYGNPISQSNPTIEIPYLFTGREFDIETGQYFYRARYYDPSIGRFISEDPISFEAGDSNLSRYVFNNPINFTDPTGNIIFLAPLLFTSGTRGAASGVTAAAGVSALGTASAKASIASASALSLIADSLPIALGIGLIVGDTLANDALPILNEEEKLIVELQYGKLWPEVWPEVATSVKTVSDFLKNPCKYLPSNQPIIAKTPIPNADSHYEIYGSKAPALPHYTIDGRLVKVDQVQPSGRKPPLDTDAKARNFRRIYGYPPLSSVNPGQSGDNAGHIQSAKLGGTGKHQGPNNPNIIPQNWAVNQGAGYRYGLIEWNQWEKQVANKVASGDHQCILVLPVYSGLLGKAYRPDALFFTNFNEKRGNLPFLTRLSGVAPNPEPY